MKELIFILLILTVFCVGIVNYQWAVIRSKTKATGKHPVFLYVILQITITLIYLLPLIIMILYSVVVYVKPTEFLNLEWFKTSVIIYFVLSAIMVILGIIFLKAKSDNYYDKDNIFMYTVTHKVIISFVLCAVAIVSMIIANSGVNMYKVKVVASAVEIEQYLDQKYLHLDISNLPNTEQCKILQTNGKCETLIIESNNQEPIDLELQTDAKNVYVRGANINLIDGKLNCKNLYLEGLAVITGDVVFGDQVKINEEMGVLSANCSFEKVASIYLRSVTSKEEYSSTLDGKFVFKDNATISLGLSRADGKFTFYGNADIYTGDSGEFCGEIIVAGKSNSLNMELENNYLSDDSIKKCKELNCAISFLNRSNPFDLTLKGISLNLKSGLDLGLKSGLNLNVKGRDCVLKARSGKSLISAKTVNVSCEGVLTLNGSTSDCYNGLVANTVKLNGKATVKAYGREGYNGDSGGSAIIANKLVIDGLLKVYLYGGNGGIGKTGSRGDTGSPGKKGNNESQGKDPSYGYDGRPGGEGGKGGVGGRGGNGGAGLVLNTLPTVGTGCYLEIEGGNGGQGGTGGEGGTGGRGGDGGDDDSFSFAWIGDMSGGEGGAGGPGGPGGDGGTGGLGSCALIVNGEIVELDTESIVTKKGADGANGSQGSTGSSGSKGSHGYAGKGG